MVAPIIAWTHNRCNKHYKPFAIESPAFVYLVLWDLGLAVSFIMTAVIQARYLPRPLGRCENLAQLDPGNGLKMWLDVLVDDKSSKYRDRLGVCIGETKVWRMTIVCG